MHHEVRYHGRLLGHFPTAAAADDYVAARLAHKIEGPAFDPDHFTVKPRRPVSLICNGNLVDTFDVPADAQSARDALLEGAEHLTEDSFQIE